MADETNSTTATTETASTTTAPATQSSGPVITPEIQALIDAAAQKAHDAGAAAARRAIEGKTKQPEPKPQARETSAASNGLTEADVERIVAERTARESAFVRSVTEHKLAPEAEGILRALLTVEKPDDVRDWVASKAKAFGQTQSAAAGTQPNPTTTTKPPSGTAGNPAAPVPAPSSSVHGDGPESFRKFDETMIRAWIRSKGGDVNNLANPVNRPILAEFNRKLEAEMAGFRIVNSK